MLRPGGYGCAFTCDGIVDEVDTYSCKHCNRVIQVRVKQRPEDLGGLCKNCMGLICDQCVDKGCTPFEKRLEQMEERDRILRSYGV